MKKQHLLSGILAILVASGYAFGQWDQSGNDIYNTNSGNVGIGTSSPEEKAHIRLVTSDRTVQHNVLELTAWSTANPYYGHTASILFSGDDYYDPAAGGTPGPP